MNRERLLAASEDHPGFVYAMRCGAFVKIGFSKHVKKRLNQIKSCNPREVHLAGTVVGDVGDEYMLHLCLNRDHYRGEWFRYENFALMAVQKFKELETAKEVIEWLESERERLLKNSKEARAKIESGEYTI